jgi:renalase
MRIAVVGAGLAGLVAARRLTTDHDVVVLEKNPIIGGRLATRRLGDAVVDSGAQFFTVRGGAFSAQVDDWVSRGLAHVWCHGFDQPQDGYPRFVGTAGMASLAQDVADGVEVRTGHMIFSLRRGDGRWDVVVDDGTIVAVDRVVLTCPVAQAWALLAQSGIEFPDELARREYHRTIGLLVALDQPSAVPAPGGVQFDPADATNPFGFIADSVAKGISDSPAVTFHATQPWSTEHWDDSPADLEAALVERARPWIGDARIVAAQVAKWRFAGPVRTWPEPFWSDGSGEVVVAGDLFAGPKVEGAFNSGLAAAEAFSRP